MKLATEAPINGGRNYDGPKVEFSALRYGDISVSTLLYAGTSEYPTVLVEALTPVKSTSVKICSVQTISRKPWPGIRDFDLKFAVNGLLRD